MGLSLLLLYLLFFCSSIPTFCLLKKTLFFVLIQHTNVRFISCDGHQLYNFKEHGVDLEVEGVRYIEMHRGPHTYWTRLLQGAEISN